MKNLLTPIISKKVNCRTYAEIIEGATFLAKYLYAMLLILFCVLNYLFQSTNSNKRGHEFLKVNF